MLLFIFGWVPDKDDSSRLLAVPSCSDLLSHQALETRYHMQAGMPGEVWHYTVGSKDTCCYFMGLVY